MELEGGYHAKNSIIYLEVFLNSIPVKAMLEANGFPSGNMCGLFCGHLETMLHVLVVLMQEIFGCLRGLSSL